MKGVERILEWLRGNFKVFEGADEGTLKYLKLPLLSYQECEILFNNAFKNGLFSAN
jgi:hypothetical protein